MKSVYMNYFWLVANAACAVWMFATNHWIIGIINVVAAGIQGAAILEQKR